MYINNKSVHRISQIYQDQKSIGRVRTKNTVNPGQDRVTLSSEGKELQAVYEKLYAPQELSAKAKELKQAIKSGTYNVSGEEIANSMIKFFTQGME